MRLHLILATLCAFPALAASQSDTVAQQRLITAVEGASGRVVRVHSRTVGVLAGPLLPSGADGLRLDGGRTVPLAGVDTLWVLGRATARGSLVGALAGAAILSAVGALICADPDGLKTDTNCYPGVMGYGLVIGASAGGVIGAAIGATQLRWQRAFP